MSARKSTRSASISLRESPFWQVQDVSRTHAPTSYRLCRREKRTRRAWEADLERRGGGSGPRRLDGGAVQFGIAHRRVRVADREEGAVHGDWVIQRVAPFPNRQSSTFPPM